MNKLNIGKRKRAKEVLSRNEERLGSLLRLNQISGKSLNEILDFALEEILKLLESEIGYIYFYDEDTRQFTLYSWSDSVMKECKIAEKQTVYDLDETGLWGEAVRQRKPIVTNNYAAPNPFKKGYPAGHVALTRHLNLPVIVDDKVTAVVGVGNKKSNYSEEDVQQLQLFTDGLWNIVQRRQIQTRIVRQSALIDAINSVFLETLTSESQEDVAATCLQVAEKLTGSKFGYIGELNPDGLFDTFAISNSGWDACKMPDTEAIRLIKNMEIRGIDRSTLLDGRSRIVNEPDSHPDSVGTPEGHPPITSFLGVPLKHFGETIGMIGLGNKSSGYDQGDQEAVETLAMAFVEALMRKRREEMIASYSARLKRSNRDLQDFAYVASHDLQEPLRKVIAFGDRLVDKYGDVLDETGRDYLARMQNATHRMQNLINDLLAFSRVTTKGQPFTRVDLQVVAKEVITDLAYRIEETGGLVEVGDLPVINADATQMRQLFQNFIGNALKFHNDNEAPIVKISGMPMGNQNCQIVIEDNGIGFDPQFADSIFQPFQRLHGRGEYEGSGIGLAICRRIAERHGGKIVAKSTPSEGATFIITLPIHQPAS